MGKNNTPKQDPKPTKDWPKPPTYGPDEWAKLDTPEKRRGAWLMLFNGGMMMDAEKPSDGDLQAYVDRVMAGQPGHGDPAPTPDRAEHYVREAEVREKDLRMKLETAEGLLAEAQTKLAEMERNEREAVEHRDGQEQELQRLRRLLGDGVELLGLLDSKAKGAEVRGILIHSIPDQKQERPGYDRVGGHCEVMKLTITQAGVSVEKKQELLDGESSTLMAWHMAKDHAEKLLENHLVPADYR